MRTLRFLIFCLFLVVFGGLEVCYGQAPCICSACVSCRQGQIFVPLQGCSCQACATAKSLPGYSGSGQGPVVVQPTQPVGSSCACTACAAIRQNTTCTPVPGCSCQTCVNYHQPVSPIPACPLPCPTPCGAGPSCETGGKFGITFDWETRICPIVSGVSNVPASMRTVNNIVVNPDNVDLAPTWSFFTKGIGYYVGSKDCGQFRIGVRPEIVLTPHNGSSSNFFNLGLQGEQSISGPNGQSIYWGAQVDDWIVPEYLVEYQKNPWTFGLGYKVYHMSLSNGFKNSSDDRTMFKKFDLPNQNVLSLYFKYKWLAVGYNFVSDDDGIGGDHVDHNFPLLIGSTF